MVFSYKNIRKILCYKSVILYKLNISGMIFLRLLSVIISCIFANNTWIFNFLNQLHHYSCQRFLQTWGGGVCPISVLPQNYLVINSSGFVDIIFNLRDNNFNWYPYQCILLPSCYYPRRPLHDAKWSQTTLYIWLLVKITTLMENTQLVLHFLHPNL